MKPVQNLNLKLSACKKYFLVKKTSKHFHEVPSLPTTNARNACGKPFSNPNEIINVKEMRKKAFKISKLTGSIQFFLNSALTNFLMKGPSL